MAAPRLCTIFGEFQYPCVKTRAKMCCAVILHTLRNKMVTNIMGQLPYDGGDSC